MGCFGLHMMLLVSANFLALTPTASPAMILRKTRLECRPLRTLVSRYSSIRENITTLVEQVPDRLLVSTGQRQVPRVSLDYNTSRALV